MSRLAATFGQMLRTAVQVDRSKLSADVAVRATIGVAIPLVAGELSGHPLVGVTASIGALSAGFASFQGTYRSRAGAVISASAGMALSAFVGGTLGHALGYDIVITALWGFTAGLVVALGQTATVVALQSVVVLVVFSQFRFTVVVAAREAGLVLLGGLVQALLVVVVWPLRRFPAERRALSQVYDLLGAYARDMSSASTPLLPPGAFDQLDPVLQDPQPFGGGVETATHRALADQAERIRLELTALARVRQHLSDAGEQDLARAVDGFARAAASILDEISGSLREARVPIGWEDERDHIEAALATIRAEGADRLDRAQRAVLGEALRSGEALAGQLRSALRIAAVPAGGDPAALEEAAITRRPIPVEAARLPLIDFARARERLATLRSNLALSSEACRHGLRLAVTLAAAIGLSRGLGLAHRYWFPMTVMLVLKPDFTSTFTRGISRIAGTLVGAGVVTVALAELHPGHAGLTVLVLVWCFAANTILFANYALYSVCIASLVVTLLAFTGQPEPSLAAERSVYTVAGAALALLAYALWPTWAATYLPDRLADLVGTEGRYGWAVLEAWADPEDADRPALQRARLNARLARSNAEAAADRWMSEPTRRGELSRETVLGVLVAVRAYVQGVITLHARLPGQGPSRPYLDPFAEDVKRAMLAVAASFRAGRPQGKWPQLRGGQLALAEKLGLGGAAEASPDGEALVIVTETDLIANSVDTLGHLAGLQPENGGERPARRG